MSPSRLPILVRAQVTVTVPACSIPLTALCSDRVWLRVGAVVLFAIGSAVEVGCRLTPSGPARRVRKGMILIALVVLTVCSAAWIDVVAAYVVAMFAALLNALLLVENRPRVGLSTQRAAAA